MNIASPEDIQIVGKNSDITKILFLLHMADERVAQQSLFGNSYEAALMKTRTGRALTKILQRCNLTIDDIFLTNACKFVTKDSKDPTKEQYQQSYEVLRSQILQFSPRYIISFGKAYRALHPNEHCNIDSLYGKKEGNFGYWTLMLPHPSKWCFETTSKYYDAISRFLESIK